MDLQAFDDSRNTDLQNFQTEYADLKSQYSTTISAAINERNPSAQNTLIQKVLTVNQNMTAAIRGIVAKLSQGTTEIDTATVDSLTEDLVKYQQDYRNLKDSMDKLQTLKMIQATTKGQLDAALISYNIYLFALCVLCLVVIMLAIRASWSTNVVSKVAGDVKRLVGGR